MNSLSPSRIHWGLIYREFTLNLPSFSRIQYVPIICFANLLWIHYLLREFTRDPFICRVLTLNLLFLSRIHSQFIIFVANPLSIHYLFREFSMDPLSYSPFRYTICIAIDPLFFFANSLFIYFFSRDHYGSFICFVNSLFISVRSMTKLLRDSWTITKPKTI